MTASGVGKVKATRLRDGTKEKTRVTEEAEKRKGKAR